MRGMLTAKSWVVAGILALCLAVSVQGQICKFQHNYEAECRYRIDELSLSQIEVEVNHCNDPIDVTFEIENESPEVHWSHTFTKQDEIVSVPGFRVDVQVQMLLSFDEEKKFWVRADFITDHQKRAFFLDEKLSITSEDCTSLNKAGKIAVGFLIVLLVICGVLVGVLLYIRRRRQRRNNPHRTLVEADSISCSDLRTSGSGPNVAAEPVVSFKCPGQAMTSPPVMALDLGDGLATVSSMDSDSKMSSSDQTKVSLQPGNSSVV